MKTKPGSSCIKKIFGATLLILFFNCIAQAQTIDFQQAANQSHPIQPISWINGILNSNNSDYFEGVGIPQRILFTGIVATPGDTHALTFRHQALKGEVHAYDFLMSWDQAVLTTGAIASGPTNELLNLLAQTCNGAISGPGLDACTSATNMLAIECPDNMGNPGFAACGFPPPVPVNPVIACFEGLFNNRFIHVFGNQPVTWGELLFTGYTDTSAQDVYATYTLRWKSASDKVKITLAGRVSQSCISSGCCGYGAGCGSGSVSGGPYHFKLDELDGHTTGSQDNQIQAPAAPAAPVCDSVIISGPDSVCPSSTGNIYTAAYAGLCSSISHHWSITGAGTIVGSANGASISVLAGSGCGVQFAICDTITCDEGKIVCCRVINVDDITSPVFTNCTPGFDLGLNPIVPDCFNQAPPDVLDDCGIPTVTCSEGTIINTSLTGRTRILTRIATDVCGNSATCITTFTWIEDTMLQCMNISGPNTVDTSSIGNIYTAAYSGTCSNVTHHWSISGNGTITGSAVDSFVNVTSGMFGPFTLCDTITCTEGQIICCAIIDVLDSSSQWFPLNTGVVENLQRIQFPTNNTGFAGGFAPSLPPYLSSVIIRTTDEGDTWNSVFSSSVDFVTDFTFLSKRKGNAVTSGSGILKFNVGNNSTDWIYGAPVPTAAVGALYFINNSVGFAGDSLGNVYKTTDGGNTWSSGTFIGTVSTLESFAFFTNNVGLVVGHDTSVIAKTTDGGNTWNIISLNYDLKSVYTIQGNAFATGANSTVIKSTDNGNTWSSLTTPVSWMNFNSVFCATNNVCYVVGDYGAIIKTIDGGITWQQQNSATIFNLNSVYCTNANNCYAAGDNGIILKTSTGGDRLEIPNDYSISEEGFVFYPNPTSDILNFIFEENINHTIVISNTLGQTIIREQTLQESFSLKIDHLPKGVYLISVHSGETNIYMKKFLKM